MFSGHPAKVTSNGLTLTGEMTADPKTHKTGVRCNTSWVQHGMRPDSVAFALEQSPGSHRWPCMLGGFTLALEKSTNRQH